MFIRPEDLHFYEEIGIRKFKLVGRARPTEWILTALRAYSQRSYHGNFAEILGTFSLYRDIAREALRFLELKDIDTPKTLERLRKTNLFRPTIYINNKLLDGFLDFFRKLDCENTSCRECGYCKRYAERAISIDKIEQKFVLKNLDKVAGWIKDGQLNYTSN